MELEEQIKKKRKEIDAKSIESERNIIAIGLQIDEYKRYAWGLVIAGIVFIVGGIFLFIIQKDNWANLFGDYAGGVVASVWSLAGLLFIYIAFLGQRQQLLTQQLELKFSQLELMETRLELHGQQQQMKIQNDTLAQQRFENTFFQLVRLQNEIVQNITIRNSTGDIVLATGGDSFEKMYLEEFKPRVTKYIRKTYITKEDIFEKQGQEIDTKIEEIKNKLSASETISIYEDFFPPHQSRLGHYFRNLYNILRFVEETKDINDKKRYTRIIRAQLSAYELSLLFYNCLSENGRRDFKPLVQTYSMLSNLNWSLLINEEHIGAYDPKAFE
jgi:hypothetical protein